MSKGLISVSQALLLNVKLGKETAILEEYIAAIDEAELKNQLINDDFKKTFWINIYNAFTQMILSKTPDKYADKSTFFSSKQLLIAQHHLSLDDIEHGILRRSKIKHGMGYITNPFASIFEKKHRVSEIDNRIHFCLNCGAVSCPPIAFYTAENIHQQMDLATKNYLQNECIFNEEGNTISIPLLLKWFKADFGSTEQIMQLLYTTGVVPTHKKPTILFTKYNWYLQLRHYTTNFKIQL